MGGFSNSANKVPSKSVDTNRIVFTMVAACRIARYDPKSTRTVERVDAAAPDGPGT